MKKYTIKHLCKTYFLNYMYRVQNSIYKKSSESHGGGMAASCLANMNWKMWDGVSPTLSRPWNFCRHSTCPWRSLNHHQAMSPQSIC